MFVVWFIPFDGILAVLQLLMYGVNVGIVRSTSTAKPVYSSVTIENNESGTTWYREAVLIVHASFRQSC